MMKTIFECDQCKKNTSAQGKHLSVRFSCNSGVALPPGSEENRGSHWRIREELNGRFTHFCDEKCLAKWFKRLLAAKQTK